MATEIPTPQELAAAGQAKIRSTLDPTGAGMVDLHAGSRLDLAVSVNTALSSRVNVTVADRATAGAIDSAVGDDLDIKARDLYGPIIGQRKTANAATTMVYLQRTGTSQTVFPGGSRFSVPSAPGQTGIAFMVNEDTPVASGVTKAAVAVTCQQKGVIGNVLQSLITAITDTLPDTTWVIYQPAPGDPVLAGGVIDVVAGGQDAEDDPTFRARVKQGSFDDSRQRGTRVAVLSGALVVPGVFSAVVVEPADGTLLVFAGDVGYQLSAQLKAAIKTELEKWRPMGSPVLVLPFTVVKLAVAVTLYMERALVNYNIQKLQKDATNAILRYFSNRLRPDEYFLDQMASAAEGVDPETQSAAVTSPSESQKRPADSAYAGVTTINRYVVDNTSVQVSVAAPQTL